MKGKGLSFGQMMKFFLKDESKFESSEYPKTKGKN
jgi:hypothetical protein